ncbi:sigma-54 dependent transcriptional regulator [Pseudomonas sp. NyZ704]|nr:sigma-54 dependent transcriptional regulator [Pseudomonas sp. NyZ704]
MDKTILVVEDDRLLAENIQNYLQRRDYEAVICDSAERALELLNTTRPDIVLTDNSLPGMSGIELIRKLQASAPSLKTIMMTGYGNIENAVEAMQAGAFHYLTKPIALSELKVLMEKAFGTLKLEQKLSFYQKREAENAGFETLVGGSPAMLALKDRITRILAAESLMKNTDLPVVLIEGETGTGKELVARALHFEGARRDNPFVEINCAAIPPQLLEAELFGHEKGAFTDAKERRLGLVETADGGTLFLDEVGELDLAMQAKLLKLLEDRSVRRVGSAKERKVDVRIISATNCDLEQMVRQGRFRKDLFFRLRIISLKVPSLRDRGADVLLLARYFLDLHGKRYGKPNLQFSRDAEDLIASYSWPGNVRELKNMLEQAALLAPDQIVSVAQLSVCPSLATTYARRIGDLENTRFTRQTDNSEEVSGGSCGKDKVLGALERTDWNVTKSARMLGITRDMLRYKIEKMGLVRPERHS